MAGIRLSRRGFLTASLGGAAVGLAGASGYWFLRKPVRLALVGAGIEGTSLARFINRSWWMGGLFLGNSGRCAMSIATRPRS